jgi:hypothetical protein
VSLKFDPVGKQLDRGTPVATVSVSGGGSTSAGAADALPAPSFRWKLRHDL